MLQIPAAMPNGTRTWPFIKKTNNAVTVVARLISLFFMKHTADVVAPKLAESLFVAIAICTGIPAIRYAGIEINAPPPAMASKRPARNTNEHMMINVVGDNKE